MASSSSGTMPTEPPKLLDQVRGAIRARHYRRRTEEAYVYWIRKYILFHGKRHPREMGEAPVKAHVSASTQNQALSGLLFLYRAVLHVDLGEIAPPPRARTPHRVPVVLSPTDVRKVLESLEGMPRLVSMLLYGAGLRLQECLELRVKDLDFERREITVRRGKGQKDRRVMCPESVREVLCGHLARCGCSMKRTWAVVWGE